MATKATKAPGPCFNHCPNYFSKEERKKKPMHSSLHYPASKKWNLVGTEDTSLMRENCVGNKNALGWKSVDLGRDFKQITFPLWMSVGPSIKELVWTRTSHWNRTALIVYGSLKWALFLPEETMKSLKCGLRLLTGPSQRSQSTSNARRRHVAQSLRAAHEWASKAGRSRAIYQALGFSSLAKSGK